MELKVIDEKLSVCKVKDYSRVDMTVPFTFTGCTDRERSLVCPTASVPPGTVARDDGWRALVIEGTLDFSLVGILSGISAVLAENGIGIFAVSTFDTDYVLVKAENLGKAVASLKEAGYGIKDRGVSWRPEGCRGT